MLSSTQNDIDPNNNGRGILKKLNLTMLDWKRPLKIFFLGISIMQLLACSKTVEWKEEVQLNDGRVIVVTQKKRCEGGDYKAKEDATCIAREAWLTINLTEFSDKEILWHESLKPMVLNIHQGHLYVVGFPPHTLEFRAYGATNPPYFGFIWEANAWKRIPFIKIPEAIYDANMLIASIPMTKTDYLTLAQKNSAKENGALTKPPCLHRIDPEYTTSPY
jgi:hypothetical protein